MSPGVRSVLEVAPGGPAGHVSQSGRSAHVAKLDRELSVTLLHRTSRRVSLTEDGRRLLPLIRQALAGVDAVTDTANAICGVPTGSLRVGAVTGLTWDPLVDAPALRSLLGA